MSEASFRKEVEHTIKLYEKEIGHVATRTWPMIERYGEVEALSRLMVSADLQQGFKVLRDRNQLNNTFEDLVVRFKHLFPSVWSKPPSLDGDFDFNVLTHARL